MIKYVIDYIFDAYEKLIWYGVEEELKHQKRLNKIIPYLISKGSIVSMNPNKLDFRRFVVEKIDRNQQIISIRQINNIGYFSYAWLTYTGPDLESIREVKGFEISVSNLEILKTMIRVLFRSSKNIFHVLHYKVPVV